jgi:hypothetical protein
MSRIQEAISGWSRQQDIATTPQNSLESMFDSVGMMRGDLAPVMRFGTGFAAGAVLMWALRPGFAFDKDGRALGWKGIGGTATIPWWAPPAALGVFCGVFV